MKRRSGLPACEAWCACDLKFGTPKFSITTYRLVAAEKFQAAKQDGSSHPAFNFIYKSNEVAALESPPGETTTQVMALGHPPGDHRDTQVQLQAPRYGLGPYLALGHTLVDDRWYELLRPPQSYWWAAVGEPPSDLEKSGPLKIPTRVRLLKNTLHNNLHLGFWDLKFSS